MEGWEGRTQEWPCSALPTLHVRCRIPVPSLSSESNRRTIRDAASADKTPVRAAVTESSDNNASANLERNSTSSNHLRGRTEGGRVKPSRTDDAVVEGNTQAACNEFAIHHTANHPINPPSGSRIARTGRAIPAGVDSERCRRGRRFLATVFLLHWVGKPQQRTKADQQRLCACRTTE